MNPFNLVLASVLALTLFSGGGACLLAALGTNMSQAQKAVIEKLIHIALLGAGAIITLLGRFH